MAMASAPMKSTIRSPMVSCRAAWPVSASPPSRAYFCMLVWNSASSARAKQNVNSATNAGLMLTGMPSVLLRKVSTAHPSAPSIAPLSACRTRGSRRAAMPSRHCSSMRT